MKFPFRVVTSFEDATRNFEFAETQFTTSAKWKPLAYAASWGDFSSPPWQAGQYALDGNGFVHLRGLIRKTVAYTVGETIATLPVGFRPVQSEMFQAIAYDGTNGQFITRVDVLSDGTVDAFYQSVPTYTTPGALTWITLSGITFQQGG